VKQANGRVETSQVQGASIIPLLTIHRWQYILSRNCSRQRTKLIPYSRMLQREREKLR
jgi:hypothetical protein